MGWQSRGEPEVAPVEPFQASSSGRRSLIHSSSSRTHVPNARENRLMNLKLSRERLWWSVSAFLLVVALGATAVLVVAGRVGRLGLGRPRK